MSAPVVDHVKRTVIQEIKANSPFNIFNIIAIVAVLVIGYFLYKKFTEKFQKGSIKIPDIMPTAPRVVEKAAAVVEAVPSKPEAIPEPGAGDS
jgi:hypothetical protein